VLGHGGYTVALSGLAVPDAELFQHYREMAGWDLR
jgi:hypothetical protein